MDPRYTAFIEAALERDPGLRLASQFAPAGPQRQQFLAAAVLQRELVDSAVALADRSVALAKLHWWLDEAQELAHGHPRHPLSAAWAANDAPALAVSAAAAVQWVQAPSATDSAAVQQALAPLAHGVALLGGCPTSSQIHGLAIHNHALRLASSAFADLASVLPMDLLARHGQRRSQIAQTDPSKLRALFADCARAWLRVSGSDLPLAAASSALSAWNAIESRWLARLARNGEVADLRLGPLDVFAAWWWARRATG